MCLHRFCKYSGRCRYEVMIYVFKFAVEELERVLLFKCMARTSILHLDAGCELNTLIMLNDLRFQIYKN